jgi:uncharacterized protein (TIGR00290 family)
MSQVVVLWSGGKESCFACYKAMVDGFKVSYLLNFVSKDKRCISHGLDSKLMVAQSQAVGIPIIQKEVTWNTYEEEFKAIMRKLKQMGIRRAVFGDIDIQEHKDWVYRVCGEVDIKPMEPLWGLDPEQILIDFIDEGFKGIVVNVKADLFGKGWLGRKVDRSFIEDLQKLQREYKIHICGELGEYHTFVIDGPIFKRRIKILDSRRVLKEGLWKFWLLDILRWKDEEKLVR